MLGAAGVQIPENNLDNLHSSREEDGTSETVDPQDLLGLGVSLSRVVGSLRGTSAVVVILVKGNAFPTIVKVRPVVARIKVIKEEYEVLYLLKINEDLFIYNTPLGTTFNEFSRLSGMYDNLFTYEARIPKLCNTPRVEGQLDNLDNVDLDVYENLKYRDHETMGKKVKDNVIATWLIWSYKRKFEDYMEIKKHKEVFGLDTDMEYDPSNVNIAEWLASKFCNHKTMDWYMKNALWIYRTRGDDEVVLTEVELSELEEELDDRTKIAEIFRIKTDLFHFETPLCKAFMEGNKQLHTNDDVLTKETPRFETYDEDAWLYKWNNEVPWVDEKPWLENESCTEPLEPKEDDDDDIGELEDYLIHNDAPFVINKEKELYKERRCKFLGIPYKRPLIFNSKKFELIEYSLGLEEEYMVMKESEYNVDDIK
nr:SGNH hydrolase-type esterase domain-containing protein [Tanacetum cinerariifolium]